MAYLDDYNTLKELYSQDKEEISIPDSDITIRNYSFKSDDNTQYPIEMQNQNNEKIFNDECNKKFIFPIYSNKESNTNTILFFHGLNESSWDKYHPWAKKLVEQTGHTVLLFPISYHINRRPKAWGEPRPMNALSKVRKSEYKDIRETSFVNAALSSRLQNNPELFFWSGFRTYNDIKKLLTEILSGKYTEINPNTKYSLFGYSIGAFFIEHLLLSLDIFSNSKAVLFCGGPTMDLMFPISRYIYDNVAEKEMTDFYVNDFENKLNENDLIKNYFSKETREGKAFRAMLNIKRHSEYRDKKFKQIGENILAIPLTNDDVMPPDSVRKTLKYARIEEFHFPYEYDHIAPFSLNEKIKDETDIHFNKIFKTISEFINSNN